MAQRPRPGGSTYLDGNNLMGRSRGEGAPGDRERFLRNLLAHRLPRPLCVVFDGPSPGGEGREATTVRGIRVLYAGAESADAVLLRKAREGDLLVTDDGALASSARSRGARTQSGREFLRGLAPSAAGGCEKPSGLSAREVEAWLEEFGGGDAGEP